MTRRWPSLPRTLIYCLSLVALFVLFFELWRLVLLLVSSMTVGHVPFMVLIESFIVGARFDLVVTSYIMLPITILAVLPFLDIQSNKTMRVIHTGLVTIMAGTAFFGNLADIEFYNYFNVRLNGMAMHWEDTPGMMLSLIWETYPVFWYFFLYGLILCAFVLAMKWLQRTLLKPQFTRAGWSNLLFLPLALLFFFYGARGRLDTKTPIRWGIAYFSQYTEANQLALNPTFTFIHDAIYSRDKKADLKNYVDAFKRPEAENMVRGLLSLESISDRAAAPRIHRSITFDPPSDDPPSVILIIMESFGATKIDILNNQFPVALSPHFDSLANEGTLFTNFYSEGMHTYSGVYSTLFGYPHLLGKLIMKQVRGEFHQYGLPSIFKDNGYETLFALTHDPHFDNMQGFMIANGFNRVISSLDFGSEHQLTTWGVPDHVLFDRTFDELQKLKDDKFFVTVLTASNHGPWIVPDTPFERVPENTVDEEILNAFKYSDWAMGQFVRRIQADPAFENCIIVIGADNGAGGLKRMDLDLSKFHMPLLILDNRTRLSRGIKVDKLGSQIDIMGTLMGQVRLNYDDYSFGRNILADDSATVPFAYLSEWYLMGIIEGDYYGVCRQRGRGPVSIYDRSDISKDLRDSLPDLARQYQEKAQAIFQVGYYNLFRPLPHLVDTSIAD